MKAASRLDQTRRRRRHHRLRFETLESRRVLATYFVGTTADLTAGSCLPDSPQTASTCTLRFAVDAAQSTPESDRIELAPGTYGLSFGSIDVSQPGDIDIVGTGATNADVIIDANGSRGFDLFSSQGTSSISFTKLTIQNGVANDGSGGGAINAGSLVNLSINDVAFDNNAADLDFIGSRSSGGAIQTSGNLTVIGSTFTNNTATNSGGAIDFSPFTGPVPTPTTLLISGSDFTDNSANVDGGAVNASGGDIEISSSTFSQNQADDSGGGVFLIGVDSVSMSEPIFDQNVAQGLQGADGVGGGLYIRGNDGTTVSLDAMTLTGNAALGAGGGAILIDTLATVSSSTVDGNQVTGNGTTFETGGGGIAVLADQFTSTLTLASTQIIHNSAPAAAGLSLIDTVATLSEVFVDSNTANESSSGAGGIGVLRTIPPLGSFGDDLVIDTSIISNNSTAGSGGGVGSIDASTLIIDSIIRDNTASGGIAGGVGLIGQNFGPTLTVRRSTLSGNDALANGGGIGVLDAGLFVSNVTISNNFASDAGGGIAYSNSISSFSGGVEFSTIASNAASLGSNVVVDGTSVLRFLSSIIGDPIAPAGAITPAVNVAEIGASVSSQGFNLVSDTSSGFAAATDLIGVDPRLGPLADNDSLTQPLGSPIQTRALLTSSPAIDAGAGAPLAVDGRGRPRPLDGNGDGNLQNDIGAFEAEALIVTPDVADLSVSLIGSPDPVTAGSTLTYRITVTNAGPDPATGVQVVDDLPADVTFVRGFVGADPGSGTPDPRVTLAAGSVLADLDSLASGATVTVTIIVSVSDAAVGPLLNSAFVTSNPDIDPDDGNNSDSVFTNVVPPTVNPPNVSGHVYCDVNGDGVENPLEAIGGVIVFIDSNGNRTLDSSESSTTTDSFGDYSFVNVPNGQATVAVIVPASCDTIPNQVGFARTTLEVGDLARSIAAGDVDGDGDLDLFVASDLSNSLSVVENVGNGFDLMDTVLLGDRPQSVDAWQPPQSGSRAVVAVAGIGTPANKGTIYRWGNGIVTEFKAGDGPIAVVVDDFDQDGVADIASVASRSSDVAVTLGNGIVSTIPGLRNVRTLATGDFNGDSIRDLAVAGLGYSGDVASELKVMLGHGDGTFQTPVSLTANRDVVDLIATDVDADGLDDLLALSHRGTLTSYRVASSTLIEARTSTTLDGATSMAVGDFNGDGDLDVAVANLGSETIELMVGNGTGRFIVQTVVQNVTAPSDLVVADFNQDGFDEIAVANFYHQLPEFPTAQTPRNKLPSTVTILKLNVAEQGIVVSNSATENVRVDIAFPSNNRSLILDVNRDDLVSASDALQIVIALRDADLSAASLASGEQSELGSSNEIVAKAPRRHIADVNGDGRVSALDALMVINYLNRQTTSESLGPVSGEILKPTTITDDSIDQAIASLF